MLAVECGIKEGSLRRRSGVIAVRRVMSMWRERERESLGMKKDYSERVVTDANISEGKKV